jgi:hypothetical protein
VELPDHRFFIATLFQPQLSSRPETPHPFWLAFLRAAMKFRKARFQSGRKLQHTGLRHARKPIRRRSPR